VLLSIYDKLRIAGARIDGLAWDRDGNLIFIATNAKGPWTEAEKRKAYQALGCSAPAEPLSV